MIIRSRSYRAPGLLGAGALLGWIVLFVVDATRVALDEYTPGDPLQYLVVGFLIILTLTSLIWIGLILYLANRRTELRVRALEVQNESVAAPIEDETTPILYLLPTLPGVRPDASVATVPTANGRPQPGGNGRRHRSRKRPAEPVRAAPEAARGDRGAPDPSYPWEAYLAGRADEHDEGSEGSPVG